MKSFGCSWGMKFCRKLGALLNAFSSSLQLPTKNAHIFFFPYLTKIQGTSFVSLGHFFA
jgi:hypothetical protein